jgi:hypothetical protein
MLMPTLTSHLRESENLTLRVRSEKIARNNSYLSHGLIIASWGLATWSHVHGGDAGCTN